MERAPTLVSVIVPAYNPGLRLGAQLDGLATQEYQGDVEIVVADNGCRDGSIEIARRWEHARIPLRLVDATTRRGPGAARNAAARSSHGDFLAFCDADDVVSPDWLAMLVATARRAHLVGGRLETARLNSRQAQACHDVTDPAQPHLGYLPVAAGANLGIWSDVFTALGGFDESSRTGEDVDLCWRAQRLGYVFAASDAVVHKRLPMNHRDTVRRFFHYGIGDAWLYRRFAEAGMPRRTRQSTLDILRLLARGWPGEPAPLRRGHWVMMSAMTCGRLVGSVRYRVVFT